MLLESLFIILLILVFAVIFYRAAIHEYTILQKDWDSDSTNWSELMAERSPLVIRDVPALWTKMWTIKRCSKLGWPVILKEGSKKAQRTALSVWLNSNADTVKSLSNKGDLATVAGIGEQANEISIQLRRPYWLPGSFATGNIETNVIKPTEFDFVGLKKTTAEATCWISTDGAPLRIWIAHEGATNGGKWLPTRPFGKDPWNLKTEDCPWIAEVKFLEIRLRPGNMFILPPHWWVALRCDVERSTGDKILNGSWYWSCEFHGPISWLATRAHLAQI